MNLETKTIDELWLPVVGYEGIYEVSNFGNVRSLDRPLSNWRGSYVMKGKKTNSYISKLGYEKILLSSNRNKKEFSVHRLVAIAFINNAENKKEVNHIDGNKLNNHISNLEWCTRKENLQHAWDNGLRSVSEANKKAFGARSKNASLLDHCKAKVVLNKDNGVFFYSIKEAAKSVNIDRNRMSDMLNNKIENKTNLILI
jgi:hypothetical protein